MGHEDKWAALKQKWQRETEIDTASERSSKVVSSDGEYGRMPCVPLLLSVNAECGKAVIDRLEEMEDALAWRVAHEIRVQMREIAEDSGAMFAAAFSAEAVDALTWLHLVTRWRCEAERRLTADELRQIGRED